MQLLCGFFKLPLKKDTVKSFLIIFKIMFLFPAVYNNSPGRLMLKSVSLLRISHLPQFENAILPLQGNLHASGGVDQPDIAELPWRCCCGCSWWQGRILQGWVLACLCIFVQLYWRVSLKAACCHLRISRRELDKNLSPDHLKRWNGHKNQHSLCKNLRKRRVLFWVAGCISYSLHPPHARNV